MVDVRQIMVGGVKVGLLEHVHNLKAIAGFGPVVRPALAINGKVVASGRVPKRADLNRMLKEASE